MSKIKILDTYVGRGVVLKDLMPATLKFLIANRNTIVVGQGDRERLIKTANNPTSSVMSDLFDSLVYLDKLDIFQFLTLSNVNRIPPSFLISWLDLDVAQLAVTDNKSYKTLSVLPEFRDKILLDLTPFVARDGSRIADSVAFQSQIIRGALSRSYDGFKDMWLSPSLIHAFAKFYAIVLSSKIGRTYNLEYKEQMVIAAVFAMYFIDKCTDGNDPAGPMTNKLDFVSRLVDINEISTVVRAHHAKTKTFLLKDAIQIITELSPTRMNNFNLQTFSRMMDSLSSDQMVSLLSIEYPPYWCHNVLDALSGSKTTLFHTIKSAGLKNDASKLAVEIAKTRTFAQSVV